MNNNHSKIVVSKGRGPGNNVRRALGGLDGSHLKGRTVLIKPNAGRLAAPGSGVTTHPEAVAGAIEALRDFGVSEIVIGESPIVGINVMKAFELTGIKETAERYSCGLIDLDAGGYVVKSVPRGVVIGETKICGAVFDYDIILSLPVAKCHMHTGVTLGIKNMKGCLYKKEKVRYHQLENRDGPYRSEKTLDLAISDLATILLPDITVIDGYTGMEGLGPSGGDPVVSDFAVASFDPVGADMVGCLMMGRDPGTVPHLRLVSERLGMSLNPGDYIIYPENYADLSTGYREPPTDISLEFPDVELVDRDSCSACLSTVMMFLKRFKDSIGDYIPDDETLSLAIGKGVTPGDIRRWTILVGNCARQKGADNTFVRGCPPVASRIFEAISGREPSEDESE